MDVLTTEEQQVEALKKWWKENWLSIVGGVLIGGGLIIGWRLWVDQQSSQAKAASSTYEAMMSAMEAKQSDVGLEFGNNLVVQYPDSPYASLAALANAKMKLDQGDVLAAKTQLQWVLDNGNPEQIKHTARIRLARLLLGENKPDEAMSLVNGISGSKFQASYDALKGDISLAQGNVEQARMAYTQALSGMEPGSRSRDLLQMKLDNLGGGSSEMQAKQ